MAGRRLKLGIGIFVLAGLLIGAAIIIWAGASDIFLKGSAYMTYFDESVQGLQTDSAVKFRGVEIGKVESIKVAPDNRLIEVTMKIDLAPGLEKQTFAQLRTAGITGIVFIDLNLIQSGEEVFFRKVPFQTKYPVIPSRPSETRQLFTDVQSILQEVKAIDFKGLFNQMQAATRAVETFLAGENNDKIMANLKSASANLEAAMAEIRKTLEKGELGTTISTSKDMLAEASRLISSTRNEIESMKLGQQTVKVSEVLNTLEKRANAVALQLQETAENLRSASKDIETLTDRLNKQPSELIFGRKAPPRKQFE